LSGFLKTDLKLSSVLAAIGLLTVMSVSGLFFYQFLNFESMTKIERLNYLWKRDVKVLKATNHLHKGWSQIRSFKTFSGSKRAKSWLSQLEIPVKKNKDGVYQLEILILEFEDQQADHAVIQLNLVNLETKNMVWELGRTYRLESWFHNIL